MHDGEAEATSEAAVFNNHRRRWRGERKSLLFSPTTGASVVPLTRMATAHGEENHALAALQQQEDGVGSRLRTENSRHGMGLVVLVVH